MKKAEIVICTEPGYLERQARLLVYSIRTFGGPYANIPIYCYAPRRRFRVSKATAAFFRDMDVRPVDAILNRHHTNYVFANKLYAQAHREQHTDADILVWLDSDIFFLKPFDPVAALGAGDVAVRPVAGRSIGSDPDNPDGNTAYWKDLYDLLGVETQRTVEVLFSGERILEFYNAGFSVARVDKGLFSQSLENFEKVMAAGLMPPAGRFYIEQSIFSATISQLNLKVMPLDPMSNYSVYHMLTPGHDEPVPDVISQIGSVHYHGIFRNDEARNPIENLLNRIPNGKDVNHKLRTFGLLRRPYYAERLPRPLRRMMVRLRKLLVRLGYRRS